MSADLRRARLKLADMAYSLMGKRVRPEAFELIASGASGRSVLRFPKSYGRLGICWANDRPDNAAFPNACRGLQNAGIPVPAFIFEDRSEWPDYGACIVQDLGSVDLLSLKDAPWSERRAAYGKALRALNAFHQVSPDWQLQPPFDATLYRWEQEYFAKHLLGGHLGLDAEAWLASPALTELADWLASLPRVPVHRDCQSQNIMFHEGEAYFIDFQGMRMGRAEYDLASLIYDPYMALHPVETEELLRDWEEISGHPTDPAIFCACAMQRLMQALGAFANIGHNQQRDWYLQLIPTGLDTLRRVAHQALKYEPTAPVATCLLTVV